MRYEVAVHYYGRPPIQSGPMSGCYAFATHKWTHIARNVGLERARRLADEQPVHAVVCEANTATVVYQNDRAPGSPDGWLSAGEAVLT